MIRFLERTLESKAVVIKSVNNGMERKRPREREKAVLRYRCLTCGIRQISNLNNKKRREVRLQELLVIMAHTPRTGLE